MTCADYTKKYEFIGCTSLKALKMHNMQIYSQMDSPQLKYVQFY